MAIRCTFTEKEIKRHGRCTICTLACRIKVPFHGLDTGTHEWMATHPQLEDLYMETGGTLMFRVSGKAVRSLEDASDETLGRRIAESRAKRKAYRFCESLCWKVAQSYERAFTEYAQASQDFERHYDNEISHYDKIMIMQ